MKHLKYAWDLMPAGMIDTSDFTEKSCIIPVLSLF